MLPTDYLEDFLVEFEQVLQDFEKGQPSQYEQYLDELKRKTSASMYDSGIDDSESEHLLPSITETATGEAAGCTSRHRFP